ncbi:MAG: hypothetical protein LBN39_01050, partial [Planctomycetaceae bacterium]|nr:hypothetical protein [Planctomycetaceae bacterium]
AEDFLKTLKEPRTALTEYLLGRIAERQKKYDEAVQYYERTAEAMSGGGNLLRAKWLKTASSR